MALIAACRDCGAEMTALAITQVPPGADTARRFRAAGAPAAFAAPARAGLAMETLHLAVPFDAVLVAAPCIGVMAPAGMFAIADHLSGAHVIDAALHLTAEAAVQLRSEGARVLAAPFFASGPRRARTGRPRAGGLVGLWADAAGPADALLAAIRARGGGLQPQILLGGPAAASVSPPSLAFPIVLASIDVAEAVFWRAPDLGLFPEGGEAAALAALSLGVTPLLIGRAPFGREDLWRLPLFPDALTLAEYLFERGRDLRHGGLMAELRARADWTWSGWAGAASEARAALHAALREARERHA